MIVFSVTAGKKSSAGTIRVQRDCLVGNVARTEAGSRREERAELERRGEECELDRREGEGQHGSADGGPL